MWRQYTLYNIHAIFLLMVRRIRLFFSLKHSASHGQSSLKFQLIRFSRFGTNKQTDSLTHWHPIAFIEWFVYLLLFFPVSLIESIMYLELSIVWYLLSVWMLLDSWRTDWGCKSFNTSHCRKKNWVNTNLGNRNIS